MKTQLSTGYAVNAIDLFDLFPPKYISLKKKDFEKLGIKRKKKRTAERVFTCMFKMMLEDVVSNNDIFRFPGALARTIEMKQKDPEAVKKINDTHGFNDLDIIKAGFSQYKVCYNFFKPNRAKICSTPIYVGNNLKSIINSKTYKMEY